MKFTISLTVEASGEPLQTESILTFEKECLEVANIGLSLPESKQLLEALQAPIVQQQANYFLTQELPKLPASRILKDYQPLILRTLFDIVRLRSPRFTVIQASDKPYTINPLRSLFTQRTTPEMLYLETKWAALLSYSQTATLLKERVVFLSDGAANLRQLQSYLTPNAQHILDWFYLTMRFTVLQQYLQGLTKVDADGEQRQKRLVSAKWHLWHGNTTKGLELIHDLDWYADLHHQEASTKYEKIKPLIRYIGDLESYIRQNAPLIVDYSERYRYGEAISTGFVESTVNYAVAKRFTKKQQMQWRKAGAHQMLVVRTIVLNDEWENEFKKQYPLFRTQLVGGMPMAA